MASQDGNADRPALERDEDKGQPGQRLEAEGDYRGIYRRLRG